MINQPPRVVDQFGELVQEHFFNFLNGFSSYDYNLEANSSQTEGTKDYREQIRVMVENDRTTIYVDFDHIAIYDPDLAESIQIEYYRVEPYLRKAALFFVTKHERDYVQKDKDERDKTFWVSFYNLPTVYKIRALNSAKIGTLLSVSGTVTRTSEVRPELLLGNFRCMDCNSSIGNVEQQFRYTEPPKCQTPMCQNAARWNLNVTASVFVDWQKVRVQENANEIPSGAMPRTMEIILRHDTVEKAKAGDKCVFTGTLIAVPDISKLKIGNPIQMVSGSTADTGGPGNDGNKGGRNNNGDLESGVGGLKGLGVREMSYQLCFLANSVRPSGRKGLINAREEDEADSHETFTPEELKEIAAMKSKKLYRRMVNSMAPAIYGHEDVKRGMLLMLFGGVHKTTPEGIRLRGDINVCVVGDPSVSKSQFLKYVVQLVPRAVYTSGKASSAAGLTASVAKDPDTGEFTIEAGALMLADNGICCIDEFDKMDPADQVAIHEAMEQQTISIAKAGIHASLNARTSILAAANPIGGRYDRSKSLKANLNIGAPLMSRFDLFFVVLDECDEEIDLKVAQHIVNIHQKKDSAISPDFTPAQLTRYIRYAKSIKPVITEEAAKEFQQHYLRLRQNDSVGHSRMAYRITVRQLESMIRLAEALARLYCQDKVTKKHVDEAARLLRKSIIHVETEDIVMSDEEQDEGSDNEEMPDAPPAPAANGHGRKRKRKGEEEEEGETDTNNTQAPPPSPPAAAAPEVPPADQPKKRTITMSGEQYKSISNILIMILRKQPEGSGLKQVELIQQYMNDLETESADELSEEMTRVKAVIRRLVNTDRYLIVLEEATDGIVDNRILDVNPNHATE